MSIETNVASANRLASPTPAPIPPKSVPLPRQIRFIVGSEASERFSYYGMRSILTVFMVDRLLMAKEDATSVFHLFVAGCYLMPLLGGWLADRFLGKYHTILYISLFYCLGHGVLALGESKTGLFIGLALLAFGSGGIKPCVSSFVGDQFNQITSHLIKKAYNYFYWSINFGSLFSNLLIPVMLAKFGSSVAFGIPGILMALATLVFWLGRKHYVRVPPTRQTGTSGFLPVLLYALAHRRDRKPGQKFFDTALAKFKPVEVEGAKAVSGVFVVFATVSIYWALFDQHGSTWVLQGTKMDLNFLGLEMQASQIQALNPAMVMVLIPFFAYVVYPLVEKLGIRLTPLRKMSAGMVLAGLSFVAAAAVQWQLDQGVKVNIGWQFVQYLILTFAEVMISITGLEFAYTQAPRAMKSTLMSFWYLMTFVGDSFTAIIAKLNPFQGANQFLFFAVLMLVVSGIFIFTAARYRERNYLEEGS